MNRIDSPHLETVDQMLSRFMKSEMPQPWPKAPSLQADLGQISPSSVSYSASPSPLASSRFSLAASVVLILGGCWLLSNLLSDNPTPNRSGSLDGGSANSKHIEKLFKAAPKVNGSQPR